MMTARALAVSMIAAAQAYSQSAGFEVASVKTNTQMPRERRVEFGCSEGGRFAALGLQLRSTFFWSFDVRPFQVTGLPGWIDAADAVFDIEAKSPPPLTQAQCKLMVQKLLADRFHLTIHRIEQQLPAYELVIAKNPPKMRLVDADTPTRPGGGVRIGGNPVQVAPGREPLKGWTMQQLADNLTGQPAVDGRLVVDRTGLDGVYEVDLDYAFFPAIKDKPNIFDAVQDQLGLKLNSVKVPSQVIVVDRLERPDPN